MSFRRLLDRTVSLIPTEVDGTDAHGNDVVDEGTPLEGIPAARQQTAADEDTDGVDRQTVDFVYFLPIFTDDGDELELDGYSKLVDGTDTFDLVGAPELIVRRTGGRPHHWELNVRRIEG